MSKNKPMSNFYKNILWAIFALVVISLIFSNFLESKKPIPEIALNQLVDQINTGKIKEVTIAGNDLKIKLQDGTDATSKKETDASLTDTLKNLGVDSLALQKVKLSFEAQSGWQFWAGVLIPTLLPIVIIGIILFLMLRQAKTGVNQAFSFGRSTIRLSNLTKEKITFEDVAGAKEAKEELIEIVDFLKNPKKFLDLGAKIPRGVLLVGLPGTGKTLLARAVAGEAGVPFFNVSASEFVEMFVGVGAARIRDSFTTAKKASPSILFIDEIDAVGRQRGAGLGGGNDEREQTLNQILVELDGFERNDRLIVLAATNRPDVLDPALLRPGRFDRRVVLDLPDINDREAILKIHSRGKSLAPDVDLRKIGIRTPGFSGADLANLMNEGAILAARQNKKIINQEDFYNAVEKVILGPERRSRVISVKEKEITAYHESGHALVAASLKDCDPIHKVSIISRGNAGGYTMKLPAEDQHLRSKKQFLSDLAVMLAGLAAEKLIFDDTTTGASNDLKEASALARRMITRYGMSDSLGPVTFGKSEELIFLGREISSEKNYSEKVAEKIDEEVHNFINRANQVVHKILSHEKKALKAIADTLIEKETIEQEDFYAILKPFNIKPISV
jgi:cell division protease FtsH